MENRKSPGEGGDWSAPPKMEDVCVYWHGHVGTLAMFAGVELAFTGGGVSRNAANQVHRGVWESSEQCVHHAPDLETAEMYISTGSHSGTHRV